VGVISTLGGIALILLALWDVFFTVFVPRGRGALSAVVQRTVWRSIHRIAWYRSSLLGIAGPLIMVTILATWTLLLVIGWALVLWPQLPGGFLIVSGLNAEKQHGFLDGLYLSLINIATLGYGDIVPRGPWMRIMGPLEAIVGLALMTAAISWILAVYPVLARRQRLAHEVTLLSEAKAASGKGLLDLDPSVSRQALANLTEHLIDVHSDLSEHAVTYYFRTHNPRFALPTVLPALVHLAAEASAPDSPPALRFQGIMLRLAIEDIAAEIGPLFLRCPTTPIGALCEAYAADHLYNLPQPPLTEATP
jgi:hypothetical protein